jgi:beta-lactamase regulating signal transducer with metallopeptidase domain
MLKKHHEESSMSTEHREQIQVIQDDDYTREQKIVEHRPSTRRVVVSRVSQFIWLIVALIVLLIAFRFAFYLLAVNPANGFANAIYALSNVFVAPFNGLLNPPTFENGSVVDVASIWAMIVYPLVGWAVVQLLHVLFADTRSIRHVKTVQREKLD